MNPEFVDPIFGVKVYLQVGGKEADVCRQWQSLTSQTLTPDGSHGFVVESTDGSLLLWLEDKPSPATVVHECVHLAVQTLRSRRIPMKASNEELIAYLTAFWFEWLSEVTHAS